MAVELYVDQFGVIHTETEQVQISELVIHKNNKFYDTHDNIVLNLGNTPDLSTDNTFKGELSIDSRGTNDTIVVIRENELKLWANKQANDATTSYGYLNYGNDGSAFELSIKDKDSNTLNSLVLTSDGNLTTHGKKIFHEGYMGPNTGLNADKLDGLEGAAYLKRTTEDSYTAEYLNLTNGTASLAFDNVYCSDGRSLRRITSNDGGGNFNIHNGCYFSNGIKYGKANYGATSITFNADDTDGRMFFGVAKKAINADDAVVFDNTITLDTNHIYTPKQIEIDNSGLRVNRREQSGQYLLLNQNYNNNTAPALMSFSSTSNAKIILYDSRTNNDGDAPTSGVLGHQFAINGGMKVQILDNKFISYGDTDSRGNIYFNNKALISAGTIGGNYDYIKHDDTKNMWSFVSDAPNLASNGSSVLSAGSLNLSGDNSANNLRTDYTLNLTGKQFQSFIVDPGDTSSYANSVIMSVSGNTALTTDRNAINTYLKTDDHYSGGDTDNEHRLYGIYNYVTAYKDSDMVLGGYNVARTNNDDGVNTEVKASYNIAIASNKTGTTITNLIGSQSFAYSEGAGSSAGNIYGAFNRGYSHGNSDGDTNNCTGAYDSVIWASTGTLEYAVGVKSAIIIDDNAGPVNGGALFRGDLTGTPTGTIYGVYIPSVVPNYFGGYVTSPNGFISGIGKTNGFRFPDNPGGGTGDSAELYVKVGSSENIELTLEVANDQLDIINLKTPSTTGLKHNSHMVWDAGNDGSLFKRGGALPSDVDFNNYVANKTYHQPHTDGTLTNAPAGLTSDSRYILEVINGTSDDLMQKISVQDGGSINRVWTRHHQDNTWFGWVEQATTYSTVAKANRWTTARKITLAGDTTGDVTLDGSGDVTLTVVVKNDSHTHDSRYYTENEINNKLTDGTVTTIADQWSNSTGNLTGYANDGGGNLGFRFNSTPGATNKLVEDGTALKINYENDSASNDVGKYSISYGDSANAAAGDTITWYEYFSIDHNGLVYVTQNQTIDGDLTVGGTITESSDRRIKENIVPIENALDKVTKLQGVEFNKIKTPDTKEIGFIAQDVMEVVPELVQETDTDDGDALYSVSYARTVALLVEAVKELQAEIKELKG